jgi:hypothetical protein
VSRAGTTLVANTVAPIAPAAVEAVRWALRLAMLVLVGALVLVTTPEGRSFIWVALLAVAALFSYTAERWLPAWTGPYRVWLARLGRAAEVFVAALGASSLAAADTGLTANALLPYLAVPVAVPALSGQLRESFSLLGLATTFLAVAGAWQGLFTDVSYGLAAVEWLVIAGFAAGFIGAVQRRLPREALGRPTPYAEATRQSPGNRA